MADERLNDATSQVAKDRHCAVEQLYIHNLGFIQELIHSDPRITLDEQNRILEGLAAFLPEYAGRLTEASFQAWLIEILVPLVGFYGIMRVSRPYALKAIWEGLGHSLEPSKYDDYPETVRELEQELWMWVFLHVEDLKKPGTARLTTRVYERAKIMTRAWMKSQRTRRAAVIRKVYNLPSKAKTKDAADKLAAQIDSADRKQQRENTDKKEIQTEMKNLDLLA